MTKQQMINDPNSCLNKAKPNEIVFLLRAHDVTMPDTVRDWVRRRVKAGKNHTNDSQIIEALDSAKLAEQQQKEGI